MKKHYVTFLSPGTFVHEETTREIESWDVDNAVRMASEITERYGSKPFGFRFSTKERGDSDFEPRVTARSGTHFLRGRLMTAEDLEAEGDERNKTLVSNMRINGWNVIIRTETPWRSHNAFDADAGDVLLESLT